MIDTADVGPRRSRQRWMWKAKYAPQSAHSTQHSARWFHPLRHWVALMPRLWSTAPASAGLKD